MLNSSRAAESAPRAYSSSFVDTRPFCASRSGLALLWESPYSRLLVIARPTSLWSIAPNGPRVKKAAPPRHCRRPPADGAPAPVAIIGIRHLPLAAPRKRYIRRARRRKGASPFFLPHKSPPRAMPASAPTTSVDGGHRDHAE